MAAVSVNSKDKTD